MSNCFIEAIKHRFKGYKVYYVKPYQKDGLPHFVWWDSKIGSYQHYTFKGKKSHWIKLLWFKGYIDNFPYEKLKVKLIRVL